MLHRVVVTLAGVLLLASALATGPLCAVDGPLRVMAKTAAQVLGDDPPADPSLALPPAPPMRLRTSSCPRTAAPTVIKQCDSQQDR